MWADDPWIQEHRDAARQLAGHSLAHRLDDITQRAQTLSHDVSGSWWESQAAYHAQTEVERILVRLSTLREAIWNVVG